MTQSIAFDIIGDIHGCYQELTTLIAKLGYNQQGIHRQDRILVFLGDITDRGPSSVKCMEYVLNLVAHNNAFYTPGNHCNKLYRYLKGNKVRIAHGLETTVAELADLSEEKRKQLGDKFKTLVQNAPPYLVLDDGKLVVAHAGIRKSLIGRKDKKTRDFCLYGDVDGTTLPNGRPVRKDWAKEHSGEPFIVYGHTPVPQPRWLNNTVNIDTGCVFGGQLTALRYPEKQTISVPSTIDPQSYEDNPLFNNPH